MRSTDAQQPTEAGSTRATPTAAPRQGGSRGAQPDDARRDGRAFAILLVTTFVSITATNAIRPTVTYQALGLGATPLDVGLVQAAFSILPVLTAIFVGRRIDTAGEAWFIVGGLACLAGGAALAAISGSLLVLAVAQSLMGFGAITTLVAGQALVANRGARDDRDRRYAIYTTVMAVAQLLGPAIAATIIATAARGDGEAIVFAVSAVAVLGATGIALGFPRGPAGPPARSDMPGPGTLRSAAVVLRRPGMPAAMFVSVVVISTVDVLAAYLPVYGEAAGLSVGLVGALLSIRAGATLIARLFMVRLIRRLGRRLLLAASLAVSALGLGLIPFTTEPVGLIALMSLGGLALGMGQPMTIAWVANRATRGDRATALGVRLTGNRAALLVVPALMGLIAGAAGIAAIFVAIAALLGTGSIVAYGTPDDESEEADEAGVPVPNRVG